MDSNNKMYQDLVGMLNKNQANLNKNFAGMSTEAQQRVKGPQMDFSKAISAIESGNIEELYKLAK